VRGKDYNRERSPGGGERGEKTTLCFQQGSLVNFAEDRGEWGA